ncbi:MAG: insulinase family protein [Woeseiaceae bacterium]|nr:insulinase family protein [Woeseiaceae bacterium]
MAKWVILAPYERDGSAKFRAASMRNPRTRGTALRWLIATTLLATGSVSAELDLQNASVKRLSNGLTVILLEDRNFPVASVQMLYRVGARDEVTGKTGLAHFLEHMAFRDSENFPDSGLTGPIYAHGGEWHGYTWTDQTTYFATVPKEQLDLLLRIEADRMTRLTISTDDMDAERGAVLAEMHMYENDPTSMLIDAVVYTSFLGHPYRNNTIGWQSDIDNLQHQDVIEFYRRHYHPTNAVLAVVGDIDSVATQSRIEELFGEFTEREPTARPHMLEPMQQGERRAVLHGSSGRRQFMIAYRAPSANDPDFAAFLVAQSLLGASSGVNFKQNDWGTGVRKGSALDGAAENVTTWYPPSDQDYVFIIGGFADTDVSEAEVEQEIEERIALLRRRPVGAKRLAMAIEDVLEQLVFDLESTEDAAHQLAYFDGMHALDTLFALPDRVAAVTATEVRNVLVRYLLPERRSIVWYLPQDGGPVIPLRPTPASKVRLAVTKPQAIDAAPLPPPVTARLSGGVPVIVQSNDFSASVYLQVVLPSVQDEATANKPVQGFSSLDFQVRPAKLEKSIAKARAFLARPADKSEPGLPPSTDPETRLEQVFEEIITGGALSQTPALAPALIVVSGDVEFHDTIVLLEQGFGKLKVASRPASSSVNFVAEDISVNLGMAIAQAQLGYIVPAAAPNKSSADAQRLLLYIVSHGYEGRLGKAAISDRGLAYYIDSAYRSDGSQAWITLAIGVDADKLDALKALLESELKRLLDEPPTLAEFEEAKSHLLGRAKSAAQSNEELAAMLAEQWLWYEDSVTPKALDHRLAMTSYQDLLDALPTFIGGATIVITE